MLRLIKRTIRLVELILYFMMLATVFVVDRELAEGVISGKYFWFYLSMGVLAGSSMIAVAGNAKPIHFN